MDFKYINDKNKTPNSKFSNTARCDSPFRNLGNYSTPPSRFAKIFNPFENHVVERLHLPTFSPSVFATISTPKTEEKFRWTIEDISNLKPADIDEATISQHVFEEDPHVESIVQQKIDTFFKEKVIVPSPMTDIVRVPLINHIDICDNVRRSSEMHHQELKDSSEASAQTVLTLPPKLPEALEQMLKPYFTYTDDQQKLNSVRDTSLYHNLFDFDRNTSTPPNVQNSNNSSPALSTSLSPIQFSPLPVPARESLEFNNDNQELRECTLSPIFRESTTESKSACRLNFSSAGMSIDASMVVPDINDRNQMSSQSVLLEENSPFPAEPLSESTVNWDMEYKHVSLASVSISPELDKMDISNPSTPHSKIFISQRKRLSESFKDEDNNRIDLQIPENVRQNRKLFKDDVLDAGYHTISGTFYDESHFSSHVFASTPSKRKN